MNKTYSKEIIEDIYQQAEKDIIFFSYASSFVNDDEDYLDHKNEILIFQRTLNFISFLAATGDFELGRMRRLGDDIKFVPYKNSIVDFELEAQQQMQNNGLHCDALSWELAIRRF